MAHPKLDSVRRRYNFCCGYCEVSEISVGGELTIDHFHPVSAGGDDSDDNLVYACMRCNLYKGALLPEATDVGQTLRLLHPLRDNRSEHIQENEQTGVLEGITATGAFHIQELRLNRPALVANRLRRNLLALLQARFDQANAENAMLHDRIARRDRYIALLEARDLAEE